MSRVDFGRLADHEYDGIQEYDNPTPGWWHLIFLGTSLFSVLYLMYYHMSIYGPSIWDQYDADVASYFEQQLGKFGDLQPDDATIVGLMKNEDYMSVMEGTFLGKCASCHGKLGEGLVGPNLTDDSYINAQSLTDLYSTIADGVVLKGMPSWERQLHPNELVLLTAYVAQLRGQNLDGPRGAQGEAAPAWPMEHPMLSFEEEEAGE
ncbi:MAG: cbb3-type cytochrome c oxidase N-terminal domain-containing protein [Planctomycetota bacterium]|jgi:cytochrome c oxidase cbb3-type subunit 3